MRFIDPDGREVWLTMYGDDGKVAEKILYTPGMEYNGKNEFFKSSVAMLNKVNSVDGGNKVLNTLSSSNNKYYYSNLSPNEGDAATTFMGDEGTFFLMGNNVSLESNAHELYHGYQIEKGVGGKGESVTNEVEAYLFGYSVAYNYYSDNFTEEGSQNILSRQGFGRNNSAGSIYNDAFKNLLTGNFTSSYFDFSAAVTSFKDGSLSNSTGLYNKAPIQLKNKNPGLIWSFTPLIK